MSYCQDLKEINRMELYVLMQHKANVEAKNMYETLLSRMASQTEQKKETYLTQFKGEWFSLLCLWIESKVTNKFVRECLSAGHVIENKDL
jgi:hypothetical protein